MEHRKSIALMRFLASASREFSRGVWENLYVVGGAVRNYLLCEDVKDVDLAIDTIRLGDGKDAKWFAEFLQTYLSDHGVRSHYTFNQYGVAILTIGSSWVREGFEMKGETIEIANCRKESYAGVGGKGKGYKPTDVRPATIHEDLLRRDFTFNTLLWRLGELENGPEGAEILDLLGRGVPDLYERTVRTPMDPDRTFSDDPTRMLRALKFHLRYDLQIEEETSESIRRNASKLENMPWEAVGTILVRDLFSHSRNDRVLPLLREYGLLDTVKKISREKPFAAYLAGQFGVGTWDVGLLLDLSDEGVVSKPLDFLTPKQRNVLRRLTIESLTAPEAVAFLEVLRRPPVNNEELIREFSLEGRDRGRIVAAARSVLLGVSADRRKALLASPDLLQAEVRENLLRGFTA